MRDKMYQTLMRKYEAEVADAKFKIDTFVDISLKRFNELYAAAGHPNCVFKINFINLQKITNGQTKDLTL